MVAVYGLSAQKKDQNSYIKVSDIKYASHHDVDPKFNMLDVYLPKKGSNSPMIIWVHGGEWAFGDKGYVQHKAEYFTSKGYVFVSINYRLSPKAKHPAHVQDVADAITWMHKNARHYSADNTKLFLMGHSEGAHLAALVTTDEKYLKNSGSSVQVVRGVALLDGVAFDIPALMANGADKGRSWCLDTFGKSEASWNEASPVNHIKPGNQTPPFLMAYSGSKNTTEADAIKLSKKLSEANVKNKVLGYPKKNNLSITKDLGEENDKVANEIIVFFHECLNIAK